MSSAPRREFEARIANIADQQGHDRSEGTAQADGEYAPDLSQVKPPSQVHVSVPRPASLAHQRHRTRAVQPASQTGCTRTPTHQSACRPSGLLNPFRTHTGSRPNDDTDVSRPREGDARMDCSLADARWPIQVATPKSRTLTFLPWSARCSPVSNRNVDPVLVRGVKRVGELCSNRVRLFQRKGRPFQSPRERFTVQHIRGRDAERNGGVLELMNDCDVRVIERGKKLSLTA